MALTRTRGWAGRTCLGVNIVRVLAGRNAL